MAIQFACPYCDQISSVPDSFAGKQGKCPSCKKVIQVPNPEGDDEPPPAATEERPAPPKTGAREEKTCHACGESILAVAKKCKYCGEYFEKGLRRRASTSQMPPQNMHWAVISLVLSMIVCVPMAPFSIVSLVYAVQVSSKHNEGDAEGALKASQRARLWAIISFVIPVVLLVFFVIFAAIA